MVPAIGSKVLYQNTIYHVQDTNHLNMSARIGVPDDSGIIWETITVSYNEIQKPCPDK